MPRSSFIFEKLITIRIQRRASPLFAITALAPP
jgi:hypothetical protein